MSPCVETIPGLGGLDGSLPHSVVPKVISSQPSSRLEVSN